MISEIRTSFLKTNSGANRARWAQYISENNIPLSGFHNLIFEDKTVSVQFSWMLGDLGELNPGILFPSVTFFFTRRNEIKVRNFTRTLAKMMYLAGIPDEIEGPATDGLFEWLGDSNQNVSTKTFAMLALEKQVQKYPELKKEFEAVVKNEIPKTSVSFGRKAQKILAGLKQNECR